MESRVAVSPRRVAGSLPVVVLLALVGAVPVPTRLPARGHDATTVVETEPNDSLRTANGVALGDQATGVVNPAGERDTWFVDLTAGQLFSVDVDAFQAGSPLDATLELIAPDGRTSLAFNDDFDGFDSRITYRVATSGRHFVVKRGFGGAGGPGARYTVNFGTVTCGAVGTEHEPDDTT